MTGFTTSAEVEIVLDERSVRAARQNLESELGQTPAAITDGGTVSAQSGGAAGGGRARRRARREHRWARERTDYAEQQVVYLEEIEDHLSDDALGGGGGGVINHLIGSATETAGDAAIEVGDTATDLATETIGSTIGNAVGGAVAGAISSNNLGIKKPKWVPLEVQKPEDLDVDPSALQLEDTEPIPLEHPDAIPVEDPSPLSVTDPSPLTVEDPSPLQVEQIDPIAVDAPESIPVSFNISGGGTGGGNAGGSGQDAGGLPGFLLSPLAWGLKKSGLNEPIARAEHDATKGLPGTEIAEDVLYGTFNSLPWTERKQPPHERFSDESGSTQSAATPTIEAITYDNDVQSGDINIDAEVHYDELDRLEDDILDEAETMIADAMEELRQEIVNNSR